ncbi:MAG: hypothetical protein K2N89_04735 [Lachnospiraceae bacterium]|nr:hypothetical protein [Lachnospiraceae bacterium]
MLFNNKFRKIAGIAALTLTLASVVPAEFLQCSAAEERTGELSDSAITEKTSQSESRSNRHTQYIPEKQTAVSPYGLDGYTARMESEYLQVLMKNGSGQMRIVDKRNGYIWGLSQDEQPEGLNKTWYQRASSLCTIIYYDKSGKENQISTESPDVDLDFAFQGNTMECGINMKEIGISFTVQMSLDKDRLSLNVVEGSMTETGDCMVKELYFLPFLGSTLEDEIPGYFFVPDGCGALIRFQKAVSYTSGIESRVYGKDPGIDSLMEAANLMASRGNDYMVEENVMTLPLFGIVHGEGQNGIMAVIDSGAEQAYITASAGGYVTKYNWVTAKFAYRTSYMKPINKAGTGIFTAQEERNDIIPGITYTFLTGEEAGYSAMAVRYREQLYEQGILSGADKVSDDIPLWVSVIGAEIQQGILFDSMKVFTTVDEAQAITSDLSQRGITNLSAALYGWEKGGLNGSDYGETSIERKLGSKSDLRDWKNMIEAGGGTLYLYKNVGQANADQINKRVQAAINMSNAYVAYSTDNSDLMYPDSYVVKPKTAAKVIQKMDQKLGEFSFAMDHVGNAPLSDYTRGETVTRKETMELFADALGSIGDRPTAAFGPSLYMWNAVDAYLDMPMSNSQYIFETDSVPFLQMVLKGAVDYYVPYMNLGFYSDYTILKTIEYGAYPSFIVAEAQSHELADTPLENMFSVHYEDWSDNIADAYMRIGKVLNEVQGAKITKHDMVASGVARVFYDNGVTILVNYNAEEVVCEGETVPALGCLVKGGADEKE